MITTSPFDNHYSDGFRINSVGCRTSRVEDLAILNNLRFAFSTELAEVSDSALLDNYDTWNLDGAFTGDDSDFIAWAIAGDWEV